METTNTIQNGINELLSVSADDALARTFAAYVSKNCRMIGVFVDLDIEQAQNLLELFCVTVWEMEEKGQSKSFELLSLVMKSLLPNVKRQILPQLIAQSKMFAALALLARELFDSYSKEERHNFKLPMIYWTTTDKHTDITEAEYLWRQKHQKPCWYDVSSSGLKLFRRPMEEPDVLCFYHVLCMVLETNKEVPVYLYIG